RRLSPAPEGSPPRRARSRRSGPGPRARPGRRARAGRRIAPLVRSSRRAGTDSRPPLASPLGHPMALAETFQEILDSLPSDWTDLQLDLRIDAASRYWEAAAIASQCSGQPYSQAEWHWRLLVARRFGHAAAAPTVRGTLR